MLINADIYIIIKISCISPFNYSVNHTINALVYIMRKGKKTIKGNNNNSISFGKPFGTKKII